MNRTCHLAILVLAGLSAGQASAASTDRLALQRRQVNRCMTHHMLGDRRLTYIDARKLCQQPPADKLAANVGASDAAMPTSRPVP